MFINEMAIRRVVYLILLPITFWSLVAMTDLFGVGFGIVPYWTLLYFFGGAFALILIDEMIGHSVRQSE